MKIALALDDTLDTTDGVQQYVLALGKYFTERGHQVHYLAGQTKRRDLANLHSLSRNWAVRFNGNRLSIPLPANRKRLKQLLLAEQYDVLHVQMPYSPLLVGRLLKASPANTKLVGTFHILPLGKLQLFGARLLQLVTARISRRLDKTISVSAPAVQFASSLGLKSSVLPNVVDWQRFRKAPRPLTKTGFTIVFLGRLVERKGAQQLLEAVKLLNIPNLTVRIGGTGPLQKHLKAWTQQYQLAVQFDGYIDEADKPAYLAQADLAVFPSLGGESFGIVLLEAMAAGAGVVLGGNNPGYASVLAADCLFNPKEPKQLAGLIQQLHDDKKLFSRYHRQQQQQVKQYDVAVIGEKLLSYYQELLNTRVQP